MAKVSRTNNHDWLAVRVTFADKSQANVTWSRNGERVSVVPDDAKKAERLSIIVMESFNLMREKGGTYPLKDLGKVSDAMARVGETAVDFDGYIEGLKVALKVTGERPKPKAAPQESTRATLAQKRGGWQLDATFRSGERMELKINRSSVGLILNPNLPSKFDEVIGLVFGAKRAGAAADDVLAAKAREVALESDDLDGWIEGLRAELFPGAAPRM